MKTCSKLYMAIAATAFSLHAQAYPGESIVRDPATGDYIITYRGNSETTELSQTIFVPSTKIDPAIRSRFRLGEGGAIMFQYTVSNGARAKQAIAGVVLDEIANPIQGELPHPLASATQAEEAAYDATLKAAIATPPGWYGNIHRDIKRVYWMPKPPIERGGIQPGRTLSGFGFSSADLPGMATSQADGVGEVLGFPDEGPLEDSAVYAELNRLRDNDFILRNAAVPTIAVPAPFDAGILLDRIRTHVATWPGKQLLDPAFAAQLDRYIIAAADAYRLNNSKAGKEHIKKIRELLEHEHKYLDHDDEDHDDTDEHKAATRLTIDRLAARVLDFDLRYVLRRTEHEHEEDEGRKGR